MHNDALHFDDRLLSTAFTHDGHDAAVDDADGDDSDDIGDLGDIGHSGAGTQELPLDADGPPSPGLQHTQPRRLPDADLRNLMTLYLRDVRRWRALDAEAEAALWVRWQAGDGSARDALICHHLGLVIAMARRFSQRGLELLDLIEEGNLALLVALEKFDTGRGLRFSTYAGWWIRYFLQTALATQVAIVRPPLRAQKRGRSGAWAQWQAMHGVAAPAAEHHAAPAFVTAVALHDADTESAMAECGHIGADVLDDVAAQRDGEFLARTLRRLVADLPPRQRALVVSRFGLDGQDECTLADLGKDSGVSRERMRQVQVVALQSLRDGLALAGVTRAGAIG